MLYLVLIRTATSVAFALNYKWNFNSSAFAGKAVYIQQPVKPFRQAFDDRQTYSITDAARTVCSVVWLEDSVDFFFIHADAAIFNDDAMIRNRDFYGSRLCIEDRISYQITKQNR